MPLPRGMDPLQLVAGGGGRWGGAAPCVCALGLLVLAAWLGRWREKRFHSSSARRDGMEVDAWPPDAGAGGVCGGGEGLTLQGAAAAVGPGWWLLG